jgi:hypothetical protein
MIHLQSNQRLYISEDLRGYVDKLIDDGTIPYAVDFLQLGFAYAVREELEPATDFDRHTITTNTDILGDAKLVVEAVAQWYARKTRSSPLNDSEELLTFICTAAVVGGRSLKKRWTARSKSQVQNDIIQNFFSDPKWGNANK